MKMLKCPNIVKIEYKGEKQINGSAFILPTLNSECMFLITAHHVFNYATEIDTDLITVIGQDKNIISLDYDSDFFTNKSLDICILKLKNSDTFICPIISSPYEYEKALMFGFPNVLSDSTRIYHALSCSVDEIFDNRIFAKIEDDISNYMNEEHKMIEGFSGCPFLSDNDSEDIYFLGIENKTSTEDASFKLVEGVLGISLANMIYNYFFKDSPISISELFKIQDMNDHYIVTSEEDCVVAFRTAVKISNDNILRVDDVIGDGYVIERNDIIEKISLCDSQFISIYGEAGSGKSALAKKVVRDKKYVLFARAEQFVSANSLNNIWNLDLHGLLKQKHVSNSKIYIVIDALEFISDKSQRYNILIQLYDFAYKYSNITIITTCRTSDRSAFLKLENNYDIQCFEVEPISPQELEDISSEFETIRVMRTTGQYSNLLLSPFYINLIIRNNINVDDVKGQNSFRKLIYNRIICLENKTDKYCIQNEDIISVVHEITFRRAKEFLLGVHKEELKSNVVKALISEGIVIENDERIRLRYDIFEDIVFENEFDKQFVNCKGDYNVFYDTINTFGRCVYRRYQIWIANKLFIKESRDKFIYHLLFAANTDEVWNKQTIIGIVKSDYCVDFFAEYKDKLIASSLLQDFIDIINLYAFKPKIVGSEILYLLPIGKARGQVISIISQNSDELISLLNELSIIKLCSDYSLFSLRINDESNAACHIIEAIIENRKSNKRYYYSADTLICPLLSILYQLADVCTEWIKSFLDTIIVWYHSQNREQKHFSKDIIRFTLKHTTESLALNNYKELIEIATVYWCEEDTDSIYYAPYLNRLNEYGLNKNADNYHFEFKTIEDNKFILYMIKAKFIYTLEWIVNFINKAMDNYFKNNHLNDHKVSLFFVNENVVREYYADDQLWLMGNQDCCGHDLLSDLIYLLKRMIILKLEAHKADKNLFKQFANSIKTILYTKSNNIALLTIIEEIGLHFEKELPGYALDLASSIEIIMCDISRYTLYLPNSTKDLLKKQIFTSIGIPSEIIKDRYKLDDKCNCLLQQYVLHSFIMYEELREKCNKICDYLYSKYPNIEKTAKENFQIQKMDARKITIEEIDDTHLAIGPAITGEAEKVVNEHEEKESYVQELHSLMSKCVISNTGKPDYDYINKTIDYILKISEERSDVRIKLERILIVLICTVLKNESTLYDRRNELCNIWLNKFEGLFIGHHPIVEATTIKILFEQLYFAVTDEIKNRIKMFILRCVRYNGNDGVVYQYTNYAVQFLIADNSLAHAYYNTILMLSNKKTRKSEHDIIEQYLYHQKAPQKKQLSIKHYDFKSLIAVTNCGLNLDDNDFCELFTLILKSIDVEMRKQRHGIEVYQSHRIVCYMQKQIQDRSLSNTAIDILFECIDFESASENTINLYDDIFNYNLSTYFDAHNNSQIRLDIQNTLNYLEQKIQCIKNQVIKIELYKPLLLSSTRYGCGDWSKIKTKYSYMDKVYLNNQLTKYGKYHFADALYSIYQLQFNELLPEILVGVSSALNDISCNIEDVAFLMQNKNNQYLMEQLILVAFLKFSDKIKKEREYYDAFESILTNLISIGNEKAAVILDEFRVH